MFNFEIIQEDPQSNARTGIFFTPHGKIETPIFMPVGTKASVKTISQDELTDLNAQIILANTYHLYLRPGSELVQEMEGLHKWMNWNKPILTDSGGFQVFSLSQNKEFSKNNPIKIHVKIDDNGVEFKSHLNGSIHYFTPEKAIKIQHQLGADIIMAFDECAPANSTKDYFKAAMKRTHEWAIRCKNEHQQLLQQQKHQQALFPIVQGGTYKDLRQESAKFINDLDLYGNAIGGLAVGEKHEIMYEMIETVTPILNKSKPRYFMGLGTPENLLEAIERGIDMFDCVHPTRMARHGAFWTPDGRFNIKNLQFRLDKKPLQENCRCQSCQKYCRSYLRHLFIEQEVLAQRMLSIHNLHFLLELMKNCRHNIKNGTFISFKNSFLTRFLQ